MKNDVFQYWINTSKGQSGSPLLVQFDGEWYVIGHHCGATASSEKISQMEVMSKVRKTSGNQAGSSKILDEDWKVIEEEWIKKKYYNQATFFTNNKIRII